MCYPCDQAQTASLPVAGTESVPASGTPDSSAQTHSRSGWTWPYGVLGEWPNGGARKEARNIHPGDGTTRRVHCLPLHHGAKPAPPASGCGITGAAEVGELRQAAFAIACRMLGSVADAEDVAQEALFRYYRAAGKETIDSPFAFLTTVTTRLAIDSLRRARGKPIPVPGFPEPLLTDQGPGLAEHVETTDSLSLALFVLLKSLSPVERAVLLLHDVFGYGYGQISRIVQKSENNCRQVAARARRHARDKRPRFEASRRQRERLAAAFFAACEDGELRPLVGLLSRDAVLHGGGLYSSGKAAAA
jgi:RNA polymerase sigma factor (sigma-70 family)